MKEKNINVLAFLFGIILFGAGTAFAQPDLRVFQWQGPNTATVNTTYQYRVRVRNIGNQTAQSVKALINLPLTETSPNRYILGKVTGLQTGCSIVSSRIECNLSNVAINQTKTVSFNLEYPVTTKPLTMTATASTTTPNEINPNNNTDSRTQTVGYVSNQIASADVLVSLCTGTGLTSFFECELFPSSIQSFTMRLEQGGTITNLPDPNYYGNWDQNISPQQLHFLITDGIDGAEFNGFGANANCFDGITNFIPASTYNSAYRVCRQ